MKAWLEDLGVGMAAALVVLVILFFSSGGSNFIYIDF